MRSEKRIQGPLELCHPIQKLSFTVSSPSRVVQYNKFSACIESRKGREAATHYPTTEEPRPISVIDTMTPVTSCRYLCRAGWLDIQYVY